MFNVYREYLKTLLDDKKTYQSACKLKRTHQ